MRIQILLRLFLVLVSVPVLTSRSIVPTTDRTEKIRLYTRAVEFDYLSWMADALVLKASQSALGAHRYLPSDEKRTLVLEYLSLVRDQGDLLGSLTRIYADPGAEKGEKETGELRDQLRKTTSRLKVITPLAEAVLEEQVSQVAARFGLTLGGQPVPPVLYHSTAVPMALIVSPRSLIRQDANISLLTEMNIDEIVSLEERVSRDLDVSSLVVQIGGVGVYPTMVMNTSSLDWLSEVVAHEWIHNYLTLRPLGISYESSPEMRTINETVASVAGKEIGREIIARYYPEMVPKEAALVAQSETIEQTPSAPVFSFNDEMRRIRVHVDELLAEDKVDEAEIYMEESRKVFLDNGYIVRKINQAYFAFHGAYADEPGGGAAGSDPVGPAVIALREQSGSLKVFLQRIAWITSYEQLQQALETSSP